MLLPWGICLLKSSLQQERHCFPPERHPQPRPLLLGFLRVLALPLSCALAAVLENSSWRHQDQPCCWMRHTFGETSAAAAQALPFFRARWLQQQALGWGWFCPPFCWKHSGSGCWQLTFLQLTFLLPAYPAGLAFSKNQTKTPIKQSCIRAQQSG